MNIDTKRLTLRHWEEDDAPALFKYASDERVGPIAGWPPHKSVEDSLEVIRTVFANETTFAIILKETNEPIGCIGIMPRAEVCNGEKYLAKEGELGYWLGHPYWGQGIITEAAKALIKVAFDSLGYTALWCGYYDGNERSHRVQQKCGFTYHHTEKDKPCELMNDIRTGHHSKLTKEEYKNKLEELKNE